MATVANGSSACAGQHKTRAGGAGCVLGGKGPRHAGRRQDGGGGPLQNPREGRFAWRRNDSRPAQRSWADDRGWRIRDRLANPSYQLIRKNTDSVSHFWLCASFSRGRRLRWSGWRLHGHDNVAGSGRLASSITWNVGIDSARWRWRETSRFRLWMLPPLPYHCHGRFRRMSGTFGSRSRHHRAGVGDLGPFDASSG